MINISCFRPSIAWQPYPGAQLRAFVGFQKRKELGLVSVDDLNLKEMTIDKATGEVIGRYVEIPCGRCLGCRLEHSRQWANRNVLESLAYPQDQSWFLTLTFDDDSLKPYIKTSGFASVRNDDISVFMKALRGRWSGVHNVSEGIRFFGASEYGDESMRPHYHLLVFGLPLYDLEYYKTTEQGDDLYISRELDDVWQKGFVTVGEFNWNTAAYTARYVMKKAEGLSPKVYDDFGIEPERTRMSRRPGIGTSYFEKFAPDFYDLDEIVLPAKKGKLNVIPPPKAFDRKIKHLLELGESFVTRSGRSFDHIIADRNRIAEMRQKIENQSHGYDPLDYLTIKEEAKARQIISLVRS